MSRPRVTAHLTAQGWILLTVSLGLFALALAGERQQPLLAWLALSVLVAFVVAALLLPRRLRRIQGRWLLPGNVHAGSETTIGARLFADAGSAPLILRAWNPSHRRCEPIAPLPGLHAAPTRVAWVQRFHRRGRCELPPLEASGEQPFGLLRGRIAIGDGEQLLVLPALGRMQDELQQELRHWLDDQLSGEDPGDDEIAYLRPYRPGDPRRRIHWRASARAQQLLVTERQAPSSRSLAIVLDTGDRQRRSRRVERLIACAATLVDHLDRFGWHLRLHGSFAPSGGMRGDRDFLLECLALIEAGGSEQLARYIPDAYPTLVLALDEQRAPEPAPRLKILTLARSEELIVLPRTVR